MAVLLLTCSIHYYRCDYECVMNPENGTPSLHSLWRSRLHAHRGCDEAVDRDEGGRGEAHTDGWRGQAVDRDRRGGREAEAQSVREDLVRGRGDYHRGR